MANDKLHTDALSEIGPEDTKPHRDELPLSDGLLCIDAIVSQDVIVLNVVSESSTNCASDRDTDHPVTSQKQVLQDSDAHLDTKMSETKCGRVQAPPSAVERDEARAGRAAKQSIDLNSSPIKEVQPGLRAVLSARPDRVELLSSPTKKQKSVAFSDNIASDICDEPPGAGEPPSSSPRLILKNVAASKYSSPPDPSNSSTWAKLLRTQGGQHCPSNPHFWQTGIIVQLQSKSNDLPQLVEGCICVLACPSFDKKFEVYATLNLVFRANDAATLKELLLNEDSPWLSAVEAATGFVRTNPALYMSRLCSYVQRDMALLESRLFKSDAPALATADPFDSRVLNQVLKLIGNLLAVPALSCTISVADIKAILLHTCDVLVQPALPKSLVAPYLGIVKDCQISPKQRKLVFESAYEPLLEKILFALLRMRNFVSSSLINEKFAALCILVQHFPAVLAKHFHDWFPGLLLSLCDISFVLYAKVVAAGAATLLEAARKYLDASEVCAVTRRALEVPLLPEATSLISDTSLGASACAQTTVEYVANNLKNLVRHGHYKHAMDIWLGLTLLLGAVPGGFDSWRHLGTWLLVHKTCFNENAVAAKEAALLAWLVVAYKICVVELHDVSALAAFSVNPPSSPNGRRGVFSPAKGPSPARVTELPHTTAAKASPSWDAALRPKIRLLVYPFLCLSSTETPPQLVHALHRLFLAVLFNIFNFHRASLQLFLASWDKIAVPLMHSLYFRKNASAHLHQLGHEVLAGLLRPSTVTDKGASAVRCLANNLVTVAEIHPFNARWLHARFEKVLPVINLVFQLPHLRLDAKLNVLYAFLSTVRPVLRKEMQPSDATLDMIENLPRSLEIVAASHAFSYEEASKLVRSLINAFGAPNLVPSCVEAASVFETILDASAAWSAPNLSGLLSMLYSAVGEKRSLPFLLRLVEFASTTRRDALLVFVGDCLNSRKNTRFLVPEMVIISRIFRLLDQNFAGIAKKLIQYLVLMRPDEFESLTLQLQISRWSPPIVHFFLVLMHDAPYNHLRAVTASLVAEKLADPNTTEMVITFLLEQRATTEVLRLQDKVWLRLRPLLKCNNGFKQMWRAYLAEISDSAVLDEVLVGALRYGIAVEDVISDRWNNFPQVLAEWAAQHGLGCSEPHIAGMYPVVAKKLDSTLADEFLQAEDHVASGANTAILTEQTGASSTSLRGSDEHNSAPADCVRVLRETEGFQSHSQSLIDPIVILFPEAEVSNECSGENSTHTASSSGCGHEQNDLAQSKCLSGIHDSDLKNSCAEAKVPNCSNSATFQIEPGCGTQLLKDQLFVDKLSESIDHSCERIKKPGTPADDDCDVAKLLVSEKSVTIPASKDEKWLQLVPADSDESALQVGCTLDTKHDKDREELSLVLVHSSLSSENSSSLQTGLTTADLFSKLSCLLKEINETSLDPIIRSRQHALETQMMELMLRMRNRTRWVHAENACSADVQPRHSYFSRALPSTCTTEWPHTN